MRYKSELDIIEKKKQKGEDMLQQLSGERDRWSKNNVESQKQLEECNSCALASSALFVLFGNMTDDLRQQYLGDMREKV